MTNKKLPENATKTEGAELARRGRGEISAATAVPHVSYDDLRHADRTSFAAAGKNNIVHFTATQTFCALLA